MFIGIAIKLTARLLSSSSPAALFANGEQGVWYNPSDISTLFQDSAGTTPVTAPGQTAGLMLDNSKNGVGSNGTYSRNQYLYTEQFDNAYWSKTNITIGADVTSAPNGTITADKLQENAGAAAYFAVAGNPSASASTTYTWSCYFKAAERSFAAVNFSVAGVVASFDLTTGATRLASGTATLSATNAGNGWWRFSMTFSTPSSGTNLLFHVISTALSLTVGVTTGVAGYGYYLWGAQLELGSPATAYQQITSSWLATIPGNHATQATAVQRPIYGVNPIVGVRNLLTYTEQFENAVWTRASSSISTNVTTAPDGKNTADKLIEAVSGASFHWTQQAGGTVGSTETFSVYIKAAERSWIALQMGNAALAYFDVGTGALGTVTGGTAAITSVGNGWYRCSISGTRTVATTNYIFLATGNNAGSYAGDGTSGLYVWGAQVESGASVTAYQKVVSQYDVTQAGVQTVGYLAFDGVDDGMATSSFTPGTNKAQVFTGVRKLSDATVQVFYETSTVTTTGTLSSLPGYSGSGPGPYWDVWSSGVSIATPATYAAPQTVVQTHIADISAPVSTLRINGTQAATSSASQGAGNFIAGALNLGKRASGNFPFNGRLYGMIMRFGPNLTTGQITSTESWVNSKTGAY